MTKAKHTAGPWHAALAIEKHRHAFNSFPILAPWEGEDEWPYDPLIASVHFGRGYCLPVDIAEANARLIASSPYMLEVLEFVLRRLSAEDCQNTPDVGLMRGKIFAAIRKAKGE